MAQCRGVPLHDEYPAYSVFFECKNFWQKGAKSTFDIPQN